MRGDSYFPVSDSIGQLSLMIRPEGKESMETIEWTPEKLHALKKVYALYKDNPSGVFVFSGHELVVGYAKYLIQYLEMQFKRGGK